MFYRQTTVQPAGAVSQGDGKIFYSISGNTTPQTRDYISTSDSFNSAVGTVSGAAAIQSVLKSSPTRNEFVAGYVDSGGTLRVLCYDGTSWTNEWSVSVGGTGTTRRFDIAYEKSSGDVMVAYSTNTAAANAVAYRTKSGSLACGTANWSATVLMPTTTTLTSGIVHWVKLAQDRRATSNLLAIIWADAAQDLGASIWSGSSFGNFPTLAQMEQALEIVTAGQDVESFDVEYESLSGDVMIAWGSGGTNGTNGAYYNTCTGGTSTCTWGSRTAMPTFLDDATHIDIAADPLTDRILFASIGNAGSDLQRGVWSGTAWTNTANADTSCATPTAGTKFVATGWLNSGANSRGVLAYYDSAATNVGWMTVSGTTWTNQTDWTPTPLFGAQRQYEIDVDPFNLDRLIFTVSDANSDIFAKRLILSGTSFAWSNADGGTQIEANTASTTYKTFDFEYNNYIPNNPPSLNIDLPAADTDIAESANYNIQYDLSDAEDVATVSFYYETDGNGSGGTAISTCQNQAEGTNATCQFSPATEGMALSTYYYIYGVASDGVNSPVTVVSTGRIRRNAAPTLSITQPDGVGDTVTQGQTYVIYYDLSDSDSVVTVDLYYDTDSSGLDGTLISGCSNLIEGTNQTCNWDTTGVPAGSYYIYGRDVNDGINPEVWDYSPGMVTITGTNNNPNAPTSLTQGTGSGQNNISEGSWTNVNQPWFGFYVSDPDTGDTVKYRIQIDNVSSSFTNLILDYTYNTLSSNPTTFAYQVGQSGGTYAVGSQGMSLPDSATGYWWRVQSIDNSGATSVWATFGNTNNVDFKVDASAPTGGTVNDGAGADEDWNNGSLTQVSANWSGFDASVSGLLRYDYAIRRMFDGYYWSACSDSGGTWQAGESWCNNGSNVSFTRNGMNLSTGVTYYISVKAFDNAGNYSLVSSDGFQVMPILSFSLSANTITFDDLNNVNTWTDIQQMTITTSTNAHGGYIVQAYLNQPLTSLAYPSQTIANFVGTWDVPQNWSNYCKDDINDCGYGYTSSDSLVQGSNRFGSGTLYCAFSTVPPGDIVADHTDLIDGSTGDVINEQFTITHKISVPSTQVASKYQAILTFIVTARF